jgi:RNA polymerase sigma-70 factor (ECF subfamily)
MIPAVGPDPGGRDGAAGVAGAPVASGEEHLEQLRRRIASAVRRACPPWLARQADDIVQTVFIRLAGLPKNGEEERRFSSMYLEKAAFGATVDEIRRSYRRKEVPLPEGAALENLAPAVAADPEAQVGAAEIGRAIQQCLEGLILPRRLAVTLYLQGCSVPESARRLGWAAKRTENLVYRGLANLRGCLVRKGLTP